MDTCGIGKEFSKSLSKFGIGVSPTWLILRSPHLSKSPRNHHVMEEGIDTNLDVDCTKAIPRSIVIYFDMKFGMGAYIKILDQLLFSLM
jgi:hypothetical protein